MSLTVIESGLNTLLVDGGRFGQRHRGLPWGGPADWVSFQYCNAILGNALESAALEISLLGPTLIASDDIALSFVGAPFHLEINGKSLGSLNTFTLRKDETLKIGSCYSGVRGYLGAKGGFLENTILGSRSSLGPIKIDQHISCKVSKCTGSRLPEEWSWQESTLPIRVTPGAEFSSFRQQEFLEQGFAVQNSSNRMGLRLSGASIQIPEKEMLSEPVCPGTIQVARDGQLLVLGSDGQTIGGYPRIAQVIRADLAKLGQLRPGVKVAFSLVTTEIAELSWNTLFQETSYISLRLQTASGIIL